MRLFHNSALMHILNFFGFLGQKYDEYFIANNLKSSPLDLRKARVLVFIHLFIIFIAAAFAMVNAQYPGVAGPSINIGIGGINIQWEHGGGLSFAYVGPGKFGFAFGTGYTGYSTQSTYNSRTGDANHAPGTSYESHVNGF